MAVPLASTMARVMACTMAGTMPQVMAGTMAQVRAPLLKFMPGNQALVMCSTCLWDIEGARTCLWGKD